MVRTPPPPPALCLSTACATHVLTLCPAATHRLNGTPVPCPSTTTIDLTSSGDGTDAADRPSAANLIIMLDRLVDRSDGA